MDVQILEANLQNAIAPQARVDALNTLAWFLVREDRPRSKNLSEEAHHLATSDPFAESPYKKGVALSLRTLAFIASQEANYRQALTDALEALYIFEELEEINEIPQVLGTIAATYRKFGDLSSSLEYQLRQLELSERLNDGSATARALSGLGINYFDQGKPEQALVYFERSLATFEALGNSYGVAMALNNMSYLHVQTENYDLALERGQQSLAITRQHNHQRMEVSVSNTLGEAYLKLGDSERALSHLETAVSLARTIGLLGKETDALKLIGQAYCQRQEPQQAIVHLEQSLKLAEQTNHKQYMYQAHQGLAEAYKMDGNFARALAHHEQFHRLKETVFNEENTQKVQNLEVLYRTETAQKDANYYASLYESEQAQRQLAEVLNQVGQVLSSTLNLNEVLDQILGQLQALVTYDRGALLLHNENESEHVGELEFVAAYGYDAIDDPLQYRILFDATNEQDIFSRIYRTKRPFTIPDVASYPQWQGAGNIPQPGSWLGVPLIRNNQVIGMLSLAREEAIPYEKEAIALAAAFASQASIALENARLFQQTKRQADEMTTLTQASQDILSSLDLAIVLERIGHHAHTLFAAQTTVLQLKEDNSQLFRSIVTIGYYASEFEEITTLLGQGITGDIAESGKAEIINDIDQDPRALHVPGTPEEEEIPLSLLCAPILIHDEAIGLMLLYRDKTEGVFTERDLNFLVDLSFQAAIAIENAQLYDQIKRFNELLEQEVALQTNDLKTAYQQLERLNRTKSDFIAITAHELRTPITVLKGYGQILQQDPLLSGHAYQTGLVDGMVSGAERLYDIVMTMLMMVKIDSKEFQLYPEPFDLHTILDAVLRNLAPDIADRRQTAVLDDSIRVLPRIEGDRDALQTVISNIVINAIKYTPDGGEIRINGRYWDISPAHNLPPNAIELIISDTGIGIAPQSLELIFTKFFQTGEVATHSSGKTKFKGGGPGLGLAIARGIIEVHNGRLWATSPGHDEETYPGSNFHIVLPQQQPLDN
jgi:signal transduction histidine kinase